ncbi:MAG: MFS transporter [Alphaproteobacteria bacterium]|nr:MFS transporter [Alphaproteobacteria bacterium]
MLRVLSHPAFAKLFAAQIVALLGTGLLTVALGLLAYDLAGEKAGAVLGTALTIKMIAYVGVAPLANALTVRLSRKAVLIGTDLARAGIALALPFIDAVWQIYVLIFLLQTASATFAPAFQATIPDILEDEADYTRALSLTRLAYEIENLVSPTVAAILLTVMSYHGLFGGTVLGFLGSTLLIAFTVLPKYTAAGRERPFWDRVSRGTRLYLATPRLRGLLALTMTAAATGAFVLVNTVVVVRATYGGSETDVAYALAAFGFGSMASALALPRVLDRVPDRAVMLTSAAVLCLLTLGLVPVLAGDSLLSWEAFLIAWAFIGLFYTGILTPSGRLLKRSSGPEDRGHLFTAQFALSHACWLITYPVAGWTGAKFGFDAAMAVLGALACLGTVAALVVWPRHEPAELPEDGTA